MSKLFIIKKNVSHIKVYDEEEGVHLGSGFKRKYSYRPDKYFKFFNWETSLLLYPEGYYKNGEYRDKHALTLVPYFTVEELKKRDDVYLLDGVAYTKPRIEIYTSSDRLIKVIPFERYHKCLDFIQKEFKNNNIDVLELKN